MPPVLTRTQRQRRAALHDAAATGDTSRFLSLIGGMRFVAAAARTTGAGRQVYVRGHFRRERAVPAHLVLADDFVAVALEAAPRHLPELADLVAQWGDALPEGMTRAHASALCRSADARLRRWAIAVLHRLPA